MNAQNPKRSSGLAAMTGGLAILLLAPGVRAAAPELSIEGWVRLASGQAATGVQVRLYDLADPTRSLGTATDGVLETEDLVTSGLESPRGPSLGRGQGQDVLGGRIRRQDPAGQSASGLEPNAPNPFNSSTQISYRLALPRNRASDDLQCPGAAGAHLCG